jgi:DNA-binding response OmpR family regulator
MPTRNAPTSPRSLRAGSRSKQGKPEVASERPTQILSVSPADEDHQALRRILRKPRWHVAAVYNCTEANDCLIWRGVSIVVCEGKLPDGSWKDVLGHASGRKEPPIFIVTSKLADEYLWSEVLNLGGYDVLSKPFSEQEVRHVMQSAWIQRTNAIRSRGVAAAG